MNGLRPSRTPTFRHTGPIASTVTLNSSLRFSRNRTHPSIYLYTSTSPAVYLAGHRPKYITSLTLRNFPNSIATQVMADNKKGGRQVTLGYVKNSHLSIGWVVVGLIPATKFGCSARLKLYIITLANYSLLQLYTESFLAQTRETLQ